MLLTPLSPLSRRARNTNGTSGLSRQRKAIQESLSVLKLLAAVILDESISDDDLRAAVFERVMKGQLEGQLAPISE